MIATFVRSSIPRKYFAMCLGGIFHPSQILKHVIKKICKCKFRFGLIRVSKGETSAQRMTSYANLGHGMA